MRDDDRREFEQAFAHLFGLTYRVAYRLLGSDADAQEVAAETLTRAYDRWSRVGDRPDPWVATVATNLALDRIRRASRARAHQREIASPQQQPAGQSELRLDLQAVLRALPNRPIRRPASWPRWSPRSGDVGGAAPA